MTTGQAGPEILRRNSIADATRRAAAKFHDRIALTFADRQWTFHSTLR